jgi:hypothetical protein
VWCRRSDIVQNHTTFSPTRVEKRNDYAKGWTNAIVICPASQI